MGNNSEIFQISTEEQYRWALSTLNQQNRPPLMLRLVMSAFEAYRRARKYGWSRPWNKYNVMNFQSFKLRPMQDQALLDLAAQILAAQHGVLNDETRRFVDDLLRDTQNIMGFIFVHEITEGNTRFEGATLSLGRVSGRRYRDRLDIIVESRIEDERSLGLSRVRIFVDPYRRETKDVLWQGVVQEDWHASAQTLFDSLSNISFLWAQDPQRLWQHWTSAYIDYFGPRQWQLDSSLFYAPPAAEPGVAIAKKQAAC
ncbi:MAG: hypothetical protein AABY83_03525 [Pseudomonadota bacterium]